jgi:hypothetical protein
MQIRIKHRYVHIEIDGILYEHAAQLATAENAKFVFRGVKRFHAAKLTLRADFEKNDLRTIEVARPALRA